MRILMRSKALGLFVKYQHCRLNDFSDTRLAAALVMGEAVTYPAIRERLLFPVTGNAALFQTCGL